MLKGENQVVEEEVKDSMFVSSNLTGLGEARRRETDVALTRNGELH